MATPKKAVALKQEFVTVNQFKTLEDSMAKLIDVVSGLATKVATPAEVVTKKAVADAGPTKYQTNPEWEEIAKEIIGEAVDHTELEYVKGGGQKFTVVIKNDYSNASADYLERHKTDRRGKEIGGTGEEGVRAWCNLISQNLKRTK